MPRVHFLIRRFIRSASATAALLLLLPLLESTVVRAQEPGPHGQVAGYAVVDLADLAQRQADAPAPPSGLPVVVPFLSPPSRQHLPGSAAEPNALAEKSDAPPRPQLGLPSAQVASPSPSASFQALADSGTHIPPDTHGAVGPNHLMATLNSQIRVQTRAGATLSTVTLNAFWAGTGATGVFDPKVLYEPFNNRWIFTAMSNSRSADSSVLIGTSRTSDPTGTWDLFRLDADSADVNWADFPSMGFNKDWVVVTANMFTLANDTFFKSRLFVLRKSNLFGSPASAVTTVIDTGGSTQVPAITYDNIIATMYLIENLGSNAIHGFVGISTITGAVGAEVYSDLVSTPSIANPWASSVPGGADFAPQSGTASKIQNNDSRIQNVIYRNGSLWTTQTAFLPLAAPTRAAVQWWQLNPAGGAVQQFGRVDDPTGTVFYAFPSLAVNSAGDVLLGFAQFSSGIFASAAYAFRTAADTAGTMRDPVILKAGETTYFKTFSGTKNRWGDYSHTVVDPVNDTSFWTIQEYAASPANTWGTWWGQINPPSLLTTRRRSQTISE